MFKLLKLSKNEKLEEVERGELKPNIFSREDKMRDFFSKNGNLNKIFPSLYYLFSERKINPKSRVDTIAFNPFQQSFVILEYKLDRDQDLEQVIKYKKDLTDEKKKFLVKKAIYNYYLKNNQKGEEFPTEIEEYNWKKGLKLVLINTEQEEREEWEKQIVNTSSVEIGVYDLEGNNYIYVESNDQNLIKKITSSVERLNEPKWKTKLENWVNQELYKLFAENNLTVKKRKWGVGWNIGENLSICFRHQFNFYPQPKIFLVNPTSFLVEKYHLKGPN